MRFLGKNRHRPEATWGNTGGKWKCKHKRGGGVTRTGDENRLLRKGGEKGVKRRLEGGTGTESKVLKTVCLGWLARRKTPSPDTRGGQGQIGNWSVAMSRKGGREECFGGSNH